MKAISIFFFVAVISFSAFAQSNPESKISARISFNKQEHDFGKILLNSDGTFEFRFTNTGNDPLVLTEVRSTCGCTVPEWTKGMIQKGQEGIIRVKYNTQIPGSFNKSIIVYTNGSEAPVVLRIKGVVVQESGS